MTYERPSCSHHDKSATDSRWQRHKKERGKEGKTSPDASSAEKLLEVARRGCVSGVVDILSLPQDTLVQFEWLVDSDRNKVRRITGVMKNPAKGMFEVVLDTDHGKRNPSSTDPFPSRSTVQIIGSVADITKPHENENFSDGKAVRDQFLVFDHQGLSVVTAHPLTQVILGLYKAFPLKTDR